MSRRLVAAAAEFYCRLPVSVSGGAAAVVVDAVELVDGAAVKTAAGALLVCVLLAGVAATLLPSSLLPSRGPRKTSPARVERDASAVDAAEGENPLLATAVNGGGRSKAE